MALLLPFRRRGQAASGAAGSAAAAAPPPSARLADPERMLLRLEWTVLRRLDGLLQGDYRTLFRGFGLDLADLREYQPHDDVRRIDWNVTARMQQPYVREFQEDREVACWFVVDGSASVDFGSQRLRKRELAAQLVGVLARLLVRYGNRVGALVGDGAASPFRLPPRSGRRHVLLLLERLLALPAPAAAQAAPGAATDLGALLRHTAAVVRRRSVVFVVSDFIAEPGWGRVLAQLAQRHEVVAVRLTDPLEQQLPDLGLLLLQDSETGEQLLLDTHDPGFRRRFAEQAAAREQALRQQLAEAGVDTLELSTAGALDADLLRFVQLRKRRSQLAAGVQAGRGTATAAAGRSAQR